MTIKRTVDGREREFTMTGDELYKAYLEQQHDFDLSDIADYFDCYGSEADILEEFGKSKSDIKQLYGDMAYEMRRNIDKYDMDWQYAREEAIHDVMVSEWFHGFPVAEMTCN